MCLYPRFMKNPKYKPNKKNGGKPPKITDKRVEYVPVDCGKCIECRNQKKREWQIRLNEELKIEDGKFITLTFTNESLKELEKELEIKESNAVATLAVRRFLERWRKKYKKSVKHWLITELGHENTERIYLHGILFTKEDTQTIAEIWKYGNIWIGDYCNAKTINYIIKYVTKVDEQHKGYEPKILTSAGIGKNYIKTNGRRNKYNGTDTKEDYKLPNGAKTAIPIYYRNKIYTEEERQNLWLYKLDKQERYVMGTKISVKNGEDTYFRVLEEARKVNKRLGYGSNDKKWDKQTYNTTLKKLRDYEKAKKEFEESTKKVLNNLQD